VSNALGTVNPARDLVSLARARGIPTLVDGAQAMPHMRVDVRDLGCDFYAFSGHKLFGPTGIGVLYGRKELLEGMPPYQGGGEMIKRVTFEKTTWNDPPYKFEAGTPDIAGAIGLGAGLDYLATLDWEALHAHERALLARATDALSAVKGLRIIGTAKEKASLVTFAMDGVHPHDIGQILDQEGVAVRTGHHCAQPVMDRFRVPATARASFAFYNTVAEVDALVHALAKVRELFP
jgi:cysteine desulfurase/selenocysteine lyase